MASTTQPLPHIGFFPLFYNLAETGRAVLIAKRYIEQGGTATFFSHGGKYEYLAKDLGCEVLPVEPQYTDDFIDDLWKYSRLEKFGAPFKTSLLKEHVDAESAAYKETNVDWILTTNNFPCSLSARVAKKPLIAVTPRFHGHFTRFPEDAELYITEIIPQKIKLALLNWLMPRSQMWSRPFNKLAKTYNLPKFNTPQAIAHGDYTFYTDFLELLNIPTTLIHDTEYFIGPLFFDELFHTSTNTTIPSDIAKHLDTNKKTILLSLGSSGTPQIFNGILNALNNTDYQVIAIYTSVTTQDQIPPHSENILLQQFVPSLRAINEHVDLAILHGGQGTIYTAAYAGKPVIGFPMQLEQHLNLEMLMHKGMAQIAKKRRFNPTQFKKQIDTLFQHYNHYYQNAQTLAHSLPPPTGDTTCITILKDIINKQTA